jgi:hypothetical protein
VRGKGQGGLACYSFVPSWVDPHPLCHAYLPPAAHAAHAAYQNSICSAVPLFSPSCLGRKGEKKNKQWLGVGSLAAAEPLSLDRPASLNKAARCSAKPLISRHSYARRSLSTVLVCRLCLSLFCSVLAAVASGRPAATSATSRGQLSQCRRFALHITVTAPSLHACTPARLHSPASTCTNLHPPLAHCLAAAAPPPPASRLRSLRRRCRLSRR